MEFECKMGEVVIFTLKMGASDIEYKYQSSYGDKVVQKDGFITLVSKDGEERMKYSEQLCSGWTVESDLSDHEESVEDETEEPSEEQEEQSEDNTETE